LDDSTEVNGCLHYVPGSHRWNLLPRAAFANDMETIQRFLSKEQKKAFKPVAIELKKGECSFHHPLMVHGSFENRTNNPRRAAVLNVFKDGVYSASNTALLKGVPPIPAGTKIGGQFFPVLFDSTPEESRGGRTNAKT
jgi:ectoine hydroxylase-related dioxygenase (phytanoyl-CoA dioxygenase family)